MTKTSKQKQAISELAQFIVKHDIKRLYTVLRHVSASGMQREISVKAVQDDEVMHLDYLVGQALDLTYGKHNGLKVRGCGMDMGFHLVDSINRATGLNLRHDWI